MSFYEELLIISCRSLNLNSLWLNPPLLKQLTQTQKRMLSHPHTLVSLSSQWSQTRERSFKLPKAAKVDPASLQPTYLFLMQFGPWLKTPKKIHILVLVCCHRKWKNHIIDPNPIQSVMPSHPRIAKNLDREPNLRCHRPQQVQPIDEHYQTIFPTLEVFLPESKPRTLQPKKSLSIALFHRIYSSHPSPAP